MSIVLNPSEVRVLGVLIEKRMTTPDAYPLTLNSLVTACNQSSNRHPIVDYDQFVVNDALINTRNQGLSALLSRSGARAHKFSEKLCEALQLNERQAAVLAELMLRGPQTPGELRQRASRMTELGELSSVEQLLDELASRSTPLVVMLPRQPGKRESRYAHLLAGEPDVRATDLEPASVARGPSLADRVVTLERQVGALEARLAELAAKLEQLTS